MRAYNYCIGDKRIWRVAMMGKVNPLILELNESCLGAPDSGVLSFEQLITYYSSMTISTAKSWWQLEKQQQQNQAQQTQHSHPACRRHQL